MLRFIQFGLSQAAAYPGSPLTHLSRWCLFLLVAVCSLLERAVQAGDMLLGSASGCTSLSLQGASWNHRTPGLGTGGSITRHRGSEVLG